MFSTTADNQYKVNTFSIIIMIIMQSSFHMPTFVIVMHTNIFTARTRSNSHYLYVTAAGKHKKCPT